jgi:hypothetical protein
LTSRRNCSSQEQSAWIRCVLWRRFNSGRAHQLTSKAELLQPRTIGLALMCSLAAVQLQTSSLIDNRSVSPSSVNSTILSLFSRYIFSRLLRASPRYFE